jgi:hypothetical protein
MMTVKWREGILVYSIALLSSDLQLILADVVGHNIQFSLFNRGLLLAYLAHKDGFLRAARRFEGLERPSNGDVEAFRDYEAEIGQLIFSALDIRGNAPKRHK